MSARDFQYIEMMKDIFTVSAELDLKSYLWGGFAVDVLCGKITREHGDLDYFTENMVENLYAVKKKYEARGYSVKYSEEFWMLKIMKDDVHATFNTVKNIDGIAHWHHIGPRGTVFFPYGWLDNQPSQFYGAYVYTCGIRFAYALKSCPKLVRAEWTAREKDRADVKILEGLLAEKGIPEDEIKRRIWSHNPYWYAQGFEEYYWPVTIC